MKKIISGVLLGLLCSMASAEDYRTFTDTEGRSIDARIIDFNAVNGKLQIERSDGKRVWVSPTIFSADDQRYIKEWTAAALVLSDSNLRVQVNKESLGDFGSKADLKEGERLAFEVTFENRTRKPIENLRIEYIYFIEVVGSGEIQDQKKQVKHETVVGNIASQERKKITTEAVELAEVYEKLKELAGYDSEGRALYDNSLNKKTEDQLEGIWIRIYGPPVDGRPSHRDVSYPADLVEHETWN